MSLADLNRIKYKIADFIVGNLTKRGFFKLLTDRQIIMIEYLVTFGKLPDLVRPKKITEKMEWLKLYGGLDRYSKFVDKYEVRKIIKKKIGSKYLVPLIGVWEKFEDIDFRKLPKQFVLKATHGSGYVFICKDKTRIDLNKLKVLVNKWLAENFYDTTREVQYRTVKPRIVCEKYLEDDSGGLTDYKIQCFNGKPKIVEVHVDRYTNHRTAFMNLLWKRLPVHIAFESQQDFGVLKRPKKFKEMLEISRILADGFPFVRIDLYSVMEKIYFGEITFIPNNGLLEFDPPEVEYELGRMIDLTKAS